eukprot:TRINITY_DN17808_c0_g1_i1.p1 TRINITY_DN17808_c0_g1~~TRINITY_DN17808_c0_g1_i1.p1  ORF type:complete len:479 (+),score=100.68 TRINITY_DN17808_c0_g1_i1:221-1657(+)
MAMSEQITRGMSNLASNVTSAGSVLKDAASRSGVAVQDYASWASSTAFAAGSQARQQATKVFQDQLKSQYGPEIVDMMGALSDCMDKIAVELKYRNGNFPIAFSVPLVQLQHNTLPHVESQGLCMDLKMLTEASYWVNFAGGAYGDATVKGDDKESVKKAIGRPDVQILLAHLPDRGVQLPGHFVAVDRKKKVVVLGVRGTSTLSDAVTDAVGDSVEVAECPGVKAHQAMLASARAVLEKTRLQIEQALESNPGFSMIVTGHSLGAGTAILCTLLLSVKPVKGDPKTTCYAYAPPPIAAPLTANALKNLDVHSFVNRVDIVPRASLSNIFHLGEECMAIDGLDISFMDRVSLIRKEPEEKSEREQAKTKILEKVSEVRKKNFKDPHEKFLPLLCPGKVYWIQWLDRPGNVEDDEDKAQEGRPRIHNVEATEFQSIVLRGGKNALTDHMVDGYKQGILGYADHVRETGASGCCNGCSVM